MYDNLFLPYGITETVRTAYIETSYVNDVNRAYTETLMEYDEAGSPGAVYTYGLERLSRTEEGRTLAYAYDGLGSVSNLLEGGGAVLSYQYGIWGETQTAGSQRAADPAEEVEKWNAYRYNGERRDDVSGLDYLRARYYASGTGRFLSADASWGSLENPMSQNRYLYGEGNPVNYEDPSGYGILSKIAGGIKKAAGAIASGVKKTVTTIAKGVSSVFRQTSSVSPANLNKMRASSAGSFGRKTPSISQSIANLAGAVTGAAKAVMGWNRTQMPQEALGRIRGSSSSASGSAGGQTLPFVKEVRRGFAYLGDQLVTAVSEAERKLCETGEKVKHGVSEWLEDVGVIGWLMNAKSQAAQLLEGAGDTWLGKGASYASGVLSAVVPDPIAGFSPALWVTDSLGKGMSEESYYQGRYDADVAMIEIGEAADAAAEVVGKILDGIEIAAGAAMLAGLLNALNGTGGPALGAQAAEGVATVGGTAVGGGTVIGAVAIGGTVLLVVAGAYGGAKYAQGRGEANIDEDREKLEEAKEKAKGEAVEGDGEAKSIDNILDGAEETTNNAGIARNFEKTGGYEKTLEDFNALQPSNVKDIQTQYGPGKVGYLEDGTTVVARPGSKTGGATLEIKISNKKIYKIRY